MVEERRTKSGELWSDLNKRRGRLAAQARRNMAYLRREIDREQRARTLAQGAADKRITDALGARFHIHVARTVLLAIREPTLGMIEASRHCLDDANRWRAMVDVALRELDGIYVQ